MVKKLVMGEQHCVVVWRGFGNCRVMIYLMLSILSLKCISKTSAEMRDVGGGTGGKVGSSKW